MSTHAYADLPAGFTMIVRGRVWHAVQDGDPRTLCGDDGAPTLIVPFGRRIVDPPLRPTCRICHGVVWKAATAERAG